MIDKKTSKSIIKAVGKRHISKIVQFSKEKGYVKQNGAFYSGPEFSMDLNGKRDVEDIQKIIIECWEYYIEKNEALEAKMTALRKRGNKVA